MKLLSVSALVLSFLLPVVSYTQPADGEQNLIGLQNKEDIKVVYHIKSFDEGKDRVGEGVSELRHLVRIYKEQGIVQAEREIHGVFDNDGAIFVFKDSAYAQFGKGKTNPNATLIKELIDQGVSIEVCGQRLSRDGLTESDMLPGVKVVLSGQVRVLDLQLEGFAYFRF